MQDLYGDYKTLMKAMKKLSKWRDILCSWTRRLLIISKLIYKYNTIPIKIPVRFFVDTRYNYSKIYMRRQRNEISENNFEKE